MTPACLSITPNGQYFYGLKSPLSWGENKKRRYAYALLICSSERENQLLTSSDHLGMIVHINYN